MHGSFHANLDLYKVTKGELSLTERLSCNDHWASGGGVLRIATPGEAAASVKWDQSRKRGITGNFTAVYQPSSVSESESKEMFKTGLPDAILVIFVGPQQNMYALRHAIKPLHMRRKVLETERQFFKDWNINHRSQTFYDEAEWRKYTEKLPSEDRVIPEDVFEATTYIDDEVAKEHLQADTECATTSRTAPTEEVLSQFEAANPTPARKGDRLLVGAEGKLVVCVSRDDLKGTIQVRRANNLCTELTGDVVDLLEDRCACGLKGTAPGKEEDAREENWFLEFHTYEQALRTFLEGGPRAAWGGP